MQGKAPIDELQMRMKRFRAKMDQTSPDWRMAVIFSKINQYYFAGTMQDGMLIIPKDDEAIYWVRRSYERAMDESSFPNINAMNSFRDAAQSIKNLPDTIYMETDVVPLALYQLFQKYFPFTHTRSLDAQIAAVRAVKSDFELSLMKKCGELHRKVLEELVPGILEEGMSEVELATKVFSVMMEEGHHGIARFGMFDTNIGLGHVAFGESSIYPTFFNGPGGNYGMSPAMPFWGNRETRLKKGDLIFIDAAFGLVGYHTDKTMTYMFRESISAEGMAAHSRCVEIQNEIAAMLKPGAIPSEIYRTMMGRFDDEFLKNFMGFGDRRVKFLGHGIGLQIDEYPVIAEGFHEPLQEGMVIALEPKKGVEKVGMVGIENTFIVTPEGGQCITGVNPGLILIS